MDKKEFDKGYKEAIEAIKQSLNKNSNGTSGSSDGLPIPKNPNDAESNEAGGGGKSQNNNGSDSRSQGKVTAEDCMTPRASKGLKDTPSNAGGMLDRQTADAIAEAEGVEKDNRSESAVEQDWKNSALKSLPKMKKWDGSGGKGNLSTKLENIWKSTTDWKSALRRIVGHAITPEDKRQAYANKNILVSQDRLARSGKDKYDSLSYMVIILDTSGSMWNEKIRLMMREAYAVALQKKPIKIVTIQNDHDIQDVKIHTNLRDFENYVKTITMKGGGGNDLQPVWNFLRGKHSSFKEEYNKIKSCGAADLIMNFTDGFLTQLKRDPITMKNLFWVIVDNDSFDLKYKDQNTFCMRINSDNIK